MFALSISAPSAEQACELARQVRANIGQHAFEEIDGWIDAFEAEPLAAAPIDANPTERFANSHERTRPTAPLPSVPPGRSK